MVSEVNVRTWRQQIWEAHNVLDTLHPIQRGPGRSAGIATDYGLDGPGIESRWGKIFRPWAHSASCTMGSGSFPGVKYGRGVLLTTHPPSSIVVMEE